MRAYIRRQTALRLGRLAAQVEHTAHAGDAGAVHDLRVAIRRLSRCLRAFAQFYPRHSWKPLRRRLGELMQACGKVRDRDVAMALLGQAGVAADAPLMGRLAEQRQAAEAELRRELRQWSERGWQRKWRARLEV